MLLSVRMCLCPAWWEGIGVLNKTCSSIFRVKDSVYGDKEFVRFFGTYILQNKFQLICHLYTFQYMNHRNVLRSESEENVPWHKSDIAWSKILSGRSNMSMNGHNADFSRQTLRDLTINAWLEISSHLVQFQLTDYLFLQILPEKEQLFCMWQTATDARGVYRSL